VPVLGGWHAAHLQGSCFSISNSTSNCRAYKLGKKRWSYNQVELVLGEVDGGARTAAIRQVVHAEGTKFHEAHQASIRSMKHHACMCRRKSVHRAGSPADSCIIGLMCRLLPLS
jgi:hypothetical protein